MVEAAYIPLDKCEDGKLYRIKCRNLAIGLFNKKDNGFIGIREKFGARYLFTEYHWDTGEPYGTVCPLEKLDIELPGGIEVSELGNPSDIDRLTKRPVAFDKPVADGGRGWYFTDTNEADQKIVACFTKNEALFKFLEELEAKLGVVNPRGRKRL